MPFAIQPAGATPQTVAAGAKPAASAASVEKSFSKALGDAIQKVNDAQIESDQQVTALANGQAQNLHNVMIALEKAEITLRLAVEVRDKVISAYQDIMRMQV
ncbi:flagellar hook-basal body complex protein FliE [Caenibacillus caldisaponilyticus]|uniref:flagellar hook-basal body complex protein FliE n=1 Tax=Caenibacillus caldisaponilyticus TaxID=1674942 RepID=UPI00098874E0|nr:flagellar hook-basal body complex protein FliE [Caenibacillus caldisaponilyticus]